MAKSKTKANAKFNEDRIKDRIENVDRRTGFYHIEKNDDLKSFKMLEGDNFLRVLPAYDEDHDMIYDMHVHYGVGTDKSSFLCPKKMKNEDCPICEQANKYQQAGQDEEARKLRPSRRSLLFVLDRDKEDEGIKLYEAPTMSVGDPIVSLCLNRRTRKLIDITDVNIGYDVIVVKKGTGMTTKYKSVTLDPTPSKLGDVSILDDIVPFEDLLHYEDYETIKTEYLCKSKKHEEEPEPEPEPEETKDELPDIDTGKGNEKDVDVDECPEGFTFGEDYEEEEECVPCKEDNKATWRACRKEHKAINKKLAE